MFVLVAVLALLAGGLPLLTGGSGPGSGSVPGLAIQAPGSSGSVHSLPWWDPRGWFGGGGGSSVPSAKVLDNNVAAVPSAGRLPRQVALGPVRRVRELAAKRTEFSRTYALSDGQQQAVISAGPVNYQDPAGRWQPINTAVRPSARPGYAFQNVTNVFRSYFGSSAGRLIRFDAPGGGWLAVGLSGARVSAPRVTGSMVTYAGVAPGVSLSYVVTAESLTERVILASPAAAASLSALHFTVQAGGGLIPQAQRDGSITLSRGALPVLRLPAPFMTDARPEASSPYGYSWSPKVAQRATWDAATHAIGVSLAADTAWLGAAARKFPVVIDPTIDISPTPTQVQNVMIEQDTPTTNFSNLWRLSVGTTSTSTGAAVRSLLSFPLGAVPAGTQLSSADLNLYYDQTFGSGTANQTVEV
ncbi:MAG TPA: DNRLRE domain-containing protein, partial [Trebonia sp.]